VRVQLLDRGVECDLERPAVAFGLGEQQTALRGGERRGRERVEIGGWVELPVFHQSAQPGGDRLAPDAERRREALAGGVVGVGEGGSERA
jgi:hypothetical protein